MKRAQIRRVEFVLWAEEAENDGVWGGDVGGFAWCGVLTGGPMWASAPARNSEKLSINAAGYMGPALQRPFGRKP